MFKTMIRSFIIILIVILTNNIVIACSNSTAAQYFIENKGQWPEIVQFKAQTNLGDIYLEKEGLTYLLNHPDDIEKRHRHHHGETNHQPTEAMRRHAFKVKWLNAKEPSALDGDCASTAYYNYFIGNDPKHWAGGVQVFNEVTYQELYEGTNLVFYGKDDRVKYDFIVAAGANPNQISFKYEGVDGVTLQEGALHVKTSVNTLIENPPVAYQYIGKHYVEIPCQYALNNGIVSFEFPEGYDSRYTLIIDPELEFSTYTGSRADNFGFTATYDEEGHLYAAGIAFGSGYPVRTGAFQDAFAGGAIDIGISKFSPDGSDLIYSTYLGGREGNEPPHSLIVDQTGALIVLGTTGSSDFPTTPNAYDTSFNGGPSVSLQGVGVTYDNGADIIITKFSPDGSSLTSSTFIGGVGNDGLNIADALKYNYADELRGEVFLDENDHILIATSTYSTDFPTTSTSVQPFSNGGQEGCILKLDPTLQNLEWSTLLGGAADDAVYSVKLDSKGNVLLGGGTVSNDFPVADNGLHTRFLGGQSDAFVAKISSDGSSMLGATYLGTNFYDQAYFVEVDQEDFVYAYGQTAGDYTIQGDVFFNDNSGMFIHKLNNDLSTTIFSTTFGNGNGRPNISPTAFLVDKCDKIYISGWGGAVNSLAPGSTTDGLPVSNNAIQPLTDGSDFYFLVLEKDAFAMHYATFFGAESTRGEHVDGGTSRFDKEGKIYQAVCSCAPNNLFPTTPNAWSRTNGAANQNCNLAAIKFSFETSPTIADFDISPSTCAPFTATFTNQSSNGTFYEWNFGDPNTNNNISTQESPVHVFTEAGTYTISLIAENPESCNGVDVIEKSITIAGNTENQVTLEVPSSLCISDIPILLGASVDGGTWSGEGVFGSSFDPSIGAGTYTITYTSQTEDCGDVSSTQIQVIDVPTIITSDPYCEGGNTIIDVVVSGADSAYTLEFVATEIDSSFTQIVNNNESLSIALELTDQLSLEIKAIGSISACTQTSTVELTTCVTCEDELGTVVINEKNITACEGEEVVLSTTSSNGVDGMWTGANIINENNEVDTNNPGEYELIYTIALEDCETADTSRIRIFEKPTISLISGPICITPYTIEVQLIVEGANNFYTVNDSIIIETGSVYTIQLPATETTYIFNVEGEEATCSNSLSINGTTCNTCESNEPLSPSILCPTDTIILEAEDVAIMEDQHYFFILHDDPIVDLNTALAINTTGIFPIAADSLNVQYYYVTTLVTTFDENNNPTFTNEHTSWGCTQPIVVLTPLKYELLETCNKENRQVYVRFIPLGGLPLYDASTTYQVSGYQEVEIAKGGSHVWSIDLGTTDAYTLELSDATNCETLTITSNAPGICNKEPTPIELLSFYTTETEQGLIIKWETASELNNNYFTLEYSQNGVDFEYLTTMQAAGNSSRPNAYQYIDQMACGTTYYRLTWTNFNGHTTIGQVLSVQPQNASYQLQINPNPSKGEVQVQFKAISQSNINVSVYNLAGQQFLQKELIGEPCRHHFQFSMHNWPAGVYFLQVSNGEWQYQEKLVKIE